jgi:hypothetical protein
MATAAAMAALRAMALGFCGDNSSNEDGICDSGGKDNGNSGNGFGANHLCCPCHAPFVTRLKKYARRYLYLTF